MDPIAYTAQIVAAKRAIEQTLPHPLGQDPD
jgi:O-methyltransferase involved in polyketide biosynthesis